MQVPFYKYEGTGNDFILIDHTKDIFFQHSTIWIQKLCDRRLGIGANGLIIIEQHDRFGFEIICYNADGSRGGVCGNGCRCAVHLLHYLGLIKEKVSFLVMDGIYHAYIKNGLIYIKIQDVSAIECVNNGYFVNTGSKHYVEFRTNITDLDVMREGEKVRSQLPAYCEWVNINFVVVEQDVLFVRTCEMGVGEETLSCGTGVVAAALTASAILGFIAGTIVTRGGTLQVLFTPCATGGFKDVYLIGAAKMVFYGTIKRDI